MKDSLSDTRNAHHIGMFDSGIGGLTVFRAIQATALRKDHLLWGYHRLPYGEKSAETVLRYSIENAIFLMDHNIKVLVVACNTASAVSVEKLRKIFNIPVIGVIEPGAEKAVKVSKHGRIAVLATKGTIQSGAYQKQIKRLLPTADVISIACPLLAQLVEEGMQDHPATALILKDYLKPLKDHKIDTVLLGCTHYPPLQALIQNEMGPDIAIVDSASTCAEKVSDILSKLSLHHPDQENALHQFFVSDNPEKFRQVGQQFTSYPLPQIQLSTHFAG